MDELTEQMVAFLRGYIIANGFGPTVREIGEACGGVSTATIHRRLRLLQEDGLITYLPMSPRTIRFVDA